MANISKIGSKNNPIKISISRYNELKEQKILMFVTRNYNAYQNNFNNIHKDKDNTYYKVISTV